MNPKVADASRVGQHGARPIGIKRIRHSDGTIATVFTVSADSTTFGSDLRYAFRKSIAKARKENKQKLGVRDYRPDRI